jgi:hypothetical protein
MKLRKRKERKEVDVERSVHQNKTLRHQKKMYTSMVNKVVVPSFNVPYVLLSNEPNWMSLVGANVGSGDGESVGIEVGGLVNFSTVIELVSTDMEVPRSDVTAV